MALKDYRAIFLSIQQIGWQGLAFVCVFSLVNYALRYLRWIFLLRHLGDRFPFIDGMICYFGGFALTTTPGKAGEAIRSIYFHRRYQTPSAHTLAAFLTERASDALASIILAIIAIYTFKDMRWLGAGFTVAIFVVVLMINKPTLLMKVIGNIRHIKSKVIQSVVDQIPIFLARTSSLLSIKMLGIGIMIALVSWSAEGYGFSWLAHRLGGEASTLLYISIFAIAMIAGAVTFLPGGLGGTEAVMYILLKLTGMGDSEAWTTTLICRLATLWFAVMLGVISLIWLENNPGKLLTE